MASKKNTAKKADVPQVTCWDEDDSSLVVEDAHEAGFKDGMHTASMVVDDVLHDLRCDLENADLDPTANTAVRMTLEMVSRLWYERKGAM